MQKNTQATAIRATPTCPAMTAVTAMQTNVSVSVFICIVYMLTHDEATYIMLALE
jgi:hypothetical protein